MSKDTIKSLKKQNDDLKGQVDSLKGEMIKLQEDVCSNRTTLTKSNYTTPDKETQKSLEYLSNEYDDQKRFNTSTNQQISRLSTRLTELATKVDSLSIAIDEAQQYSYAYNIKLMGVPELKSKESAIEISQLCEKIFKAMGVNASLQDIDIAHRVATRNPNSNQAKPIICKFLRRLTRQEVMMKKREIRNIDPVSVGLPLETSLKNAAIYDHLTPRLQQLFVHAKKVKEDKGFRFCWTKNSVIYLRKSEDSQPIKIQKQSDLDKFSTQR